MKEIYRNEKADIEMLSLKTIWIILAVIITGIAFSVAGTASAPGTSEKVIITEIYYDTYSGRRYRWSKDTQSR